MSRIDIRRDHGTTLKRAHAGACQVAKQLAEEFQLESEWDGNTLNFERQGVNGELKVDKQSISIEVRLSFFLSMLKPTIEREIHKQLDEIFGPQNPD